MFAWVVLALLVAPKTAQALQALVALFYVWAGTLKLDRRVGQRRGALREAISGSGERSSRRRASTSSSSRWSSSGGSSRRRRAGAGAVYVQLLIFHAVSWKVVGYFYPLLMFGLTAIYPLVWLRAPGETLTLARLRADPSARHVGGRPPRPSSRASSCPSPVSRATPRSRAKGASSRCTCSTRRSQCAGGATIRTASGARRARRAHQRPHRRPLALRPDRAGRRRQSPLSRPRGARRPIRASTWRSTRSERPTSARSRSSTSTTSATRTSSTRCGTTTPGSARARRYRSARRPAPATDSGRARTHSQ